jgi:hypothetical protein
MGQTNYPSTAVASYPTSTMMPTNSSSVILDGQLTLTNPYTTNITGTGKTVTLFALGAGGATFTLAGNTYTVPSGSSITTTNAVSGSQSVTIAAIQTNAFPGLWKSTTIPVTVGSTSYFHSSSAFGNNTFVLMNQNYNEVAYSTNNGVTYNAATVPSNNSGASGYYDVTFGNGVFCAVGSYYSITSTNGYTWTQGTISSATTWYSLAYGGGIFMAYGISYIAQSSDGLNWYVVNKNYGGRTLPNQICYGNGSFILNSGDGYYSGTTVDNMTRTGNWTNYASTNGYAFMAAGNGVVLSINVDYSGGNTTATGYSVGTGNVAGLKNYSINNIVPNTYLYVNAVSFVNGYFIVSANNNSAPNCAYSANGITWSVMSSLNSGGINKVSYGNGVYVGTASNGSLIAYRATTPAFSPIAFGIYATPTTTY